MKTGTFALGIAAAFSLAAIASAEPLPQANDSTYQADAADLAAKLALKPNTGRAKNVILFIGDGMGVTTVTAARIYGGQKAGKDGASNKLAMETLPYGGLSRTYSSDSLVTDSAPSATSMTTGVKSRNGTLGMNQNVVLNDCAKSKGTDVTTLFELAEQAGYATGIVSTARITHATPAAAYAHTPGRDWEADSDMPAIAKADGCKDIADQLVHWEPNTDGFEVMLGGGRAAFFPPHSVDPESASNRGERGDRRNLVDEWLARYNIAAPSSAAYVWNKAEFDAIDPDKTQHLLGLFDRSHMQYEVDRAQGVGDEPSLADMTSKAIAMLKHNKNGFVLMVEGGRIDHAHHEGKAGRALEDTLAFDAAIAAAMKATDPRDTLIVVTADHSHTLTFSGYSARSTPILGLATDEQGKPAKAADGKPYTQLGYANGPGARMEDHNRADLSNVDTTAMDFQQQSLVPFGAETHGGEDVPVFAGGPWAHLFSGVVDENFIYHVMAYASGIPKKAGVK